MGSGRSGRSVDSASPVEPPVETQLRLQTQQEELGRLHQEQEKLREELASQKVRQRLASQSVVQRRWFIFVPQKVVYLLSREDGVFLFQRRWCICCPERLVFWLSTEGGVFVFFFLQCFESIRHHSGSLIPNSYLFTFICNTLLCSLFPLIGTDRYTPFSDAALVVLLKQCPVHQ